MSLPVGPLTPEQLDRLLEAGYRRSGWFFYRTECPQCSACEPLRLEAATFSPSRSQRRARKVGDHHLRLRIAKPEIDDRRIDLFNRHRTQRGLAHGDVPADEHDYRAFLVNSYCDVIEMSLWCEQTLIAISIADVGRTSLSAVYCFFDPEFSWLSPGTYAILKQIELAQHSQRRWLYLGMYVEANQHLKYKSNYGPHQRLIGGQWRDFR
jgi:arginyl-tRNA--protein-N-Asp/Glu arginylyltransferase